MRDLKSVCVCVCILRFCVLAMRSLCVSMFLFVPCNCLCVCMCRDVFHLVAGAFMLLMVVFVCCAYVCKFVVCLSLRLTFCMCCLSV